MGKVDIKEELAVQAAVTENNDQDGNVRLTKSMSIQDMVKVMMLEIKKALPSVITPERFTRIALSALNNTPALKQCSPHKLHGCSYECRPAWTGAEHALGAGVSYPI